MAVTGLNFIMNKNEFLKKYANNKSLYIIIIIGVVFMLLAPGGQSNKSDTKTHIYDAYSDEARLENILSKINGAGQVHVMITYHGTTSYDVAFESKQSNSQTDKGTVKSLESSVITSGGTPMVKGELYPKAKGVVIIAQGAKSASVRKAITDAASAALDIAACKICVLEGKE